MDEWGSGKIQKVVKRNLLFFFVHEDLGCLRMVIDSLFLYLEIVSWQRHSVITNMAYTLSISTEAAHTVLPSSNALRSMRGQLRKRSSSNVLTANWPLTIPYATYTHIACVSIRLTKSRRSNNIRFVNYEFC